MIYGFWTDVPQPQIDSVTLKRVESVATKMILLSATFSGNVDPNRLLKQAHQLTSNLPIPKLDSSIEIENKFNTII